MIENPWLNEPDEEEPKIVHWCDHCNEPIYEGEDYVDLDGEKYHEECIEDIGVFAILNQLGYSRQTAEA